jgi:hypothetical protein
MPRIVPGPSSAVTGIVRKPPLAPVLCNGLHFACRQTLRAGLRLRTALQERTVEITMKVANHCMCSIEGVIELAATRGSASTPTAE